MPHLNQFGCSYRNLSSRLSSINLNYVKNEKLPAPCHIIIIIKPMGHKFGSLQCPKESIGRTKTSIEEKICNSEDVMLNLLISLMLYRLHPFILE